MDPQLQAQLTQDAWYAPRESGTDEYGEPRYGTAIPVKVRVVGRNETTRDHQGQVVISSHQVILSESVQVLDRFWLPEEDPDVDPGLEVIRVGDRVGERGEYDHTKIWLNPRIG